MTSLEATALIRRVGRGLLFVAALTLFTPAAACADEAADRAAAIDALNASAVAWSKGDLDGFMRCYEASATTAYVGRGKLVTGVSAIRAMYAAHFGEGPQSMGQLSFTILDFRRLGTGYALLTGRFALQQKAAASTGIFTLVFHQSAAGWGIISDHTSG